MSKKTKRPPVNPETGELRFKKLNGVPIFGDDGYLADGMYRQIKERLSPEDLALFDQWLAGLRERLIAADPYWKPKPRETFGIWHALHHRR